ncbi:MAG TPA: AAA family ATPase [Actinomycetota bacterium]
MERAEANGNALSAEGSQTAGRLVVDGASVEADGAGSRSTYGLPVSRTWSVHEHGPRVGRSIQARALLAIKDLGFHQEVLDFLERDPRVSVVGAVTQPDALLSLANTAPDATVVCPAIARDLRHPAANGRAPSLLVVAEEMTVPVLRESIEAGARAVFAWPDERDELIRTIVAVPRERQASPSGRGRVIAIFGPRGGCGTTFVACHLIAALSDQGRKCVLVDLDGSFADVTIALGIDDSKDIRTAADLLAVMEEMSPDHVENALFRHPEGFAVLLAPANPSTSSSLVPELYEAAITQLALMYEAVILHVPRSLDGVARVGLNLADEVVLVVAPDVFSVHSARRAIDAVGLAEPSGRCRVVINPMVRGAVGAAEVESALGIRPATAIRFDAAVGRVQDRGELLPSRSRGAGRDVRALAQVLVPPISDARAGKA